MNVKFSIDILKFLPFYVVSIFPFWFLFLISDLAFVLFYYLAGYRRRVVRSNLERAFPGKSAKEIIAVEKEFYRHFCDLIFETVKALTLSKRSARKRLKVKNPELIERFNREKRSVLLYAGHFGNWEWFSIFPLIFPYKCTSFYQPLSNRYFDQLIKLIRTHHGVLLIASNKGFRTLLQLVREHEFTFNLMAGDQSPNLSSPMYWTNFLHQETAFLIGAERIAEKTGQPVVFPFYRKVGRGCYEVEFVLLEEFPRQSKDHKVIEKYARMLEKNIRESPPYWLWSHKRWKLNRADLEKLSS